MLQINRYNDLTNNFILEISDELFTTMTYRTFIDKQLFVKKIIDKHIRYNMLHNILQIVPN